MIKLRIIWSLIFLGMAGSGIEQGKNLFVVIVFMIVAFLPAAQLVISGFRELLEI